MTINYYDLIWAVFNLVILLVIVFAVYRLIRGGILMVRNSQAMDKKLDLILAKLSDSENRQEAIRVDKEQRS